MSALPWDPRPGSADLLTGIGRASPMANRAGIRSAGQQSLEDAIRAFIVQTPILDLFGEGVERVASTNGGEFAGPCPLCQGTDRLRVWPTPRDGSARAWCRQCRVSGDALHWSMRIAGRDTAAQGAVSAFLVERGMLAPRPEKRAPMPSLCESVGAPQPKPIPVGVLEPGPTLRATSAARTESDSSFLDIVETWCPQPVRDEPRTDLGVTRVVFVPPVDPGSKPDVFGEATIILNDGIQLRGWTVKRMPQGRFSLEFPKVAGELGRSTPVVAFTNEAVRRQIEDLVVVAMREKGYLLAEPDRDQAGLPHKSDAPQSDSPRAEGGRQ